MINNNNFFVVVSGATNFGSCLYHNGKETTAAKNSTIVS